MYPPYLVCRNCKVRSIINTRLLLHFLLYLSFFIWMVYTYRSNSCIDGFPSASPIPILYCMDCGGYLCMVIDPFYRQYA